jgi:GNAT superfamily N-acetyltransferase
VNIRRAVESDAAALVSLINCAFQVEKFFIDRDRIDLEQVLALFGRGEFLIADLAGCVYIEPRGDRCYLGLLSVSPSSQGAGLGRGLMQAAENRARELGCDFMDIKVVDLRQELPPFYRRLGYVETGTSDFTPGVETLLPCHFLDMSKRLAEIGAAREIRPGRDRG